MALAVSERQGGGAVGAYFIARRVVERLIADRARAGVYVREPRLHLPVEGEYLHARADDRHADADIIYHISVFLFRFSERPLPLFLRADVPYGCLQEGAAVTLYAGEQDSRWEFPPVQPSVSPFEEAGAFPHRFFYHFPRFFP